MNPQFLTGNQSAVIDHNAGTKPLVRVTVGDGDRQHRRTGLLGNQRKSRFKAQQIAVLAAGAFREQPKHLAVADDLHGSFNRGGVAGAAGHRKCLEPADDVL